VKHDCDSVVISVAGKYTVYFKCHYSQLNKQNMYLCEGICYKILNTALKRGIYKKILQTIMLKLDCR